MQEKSLSGRDLLAAATIVLIWGSNFVVTKFGLLSFTPMQLGAWRFLFAMFPLILIVRPPKLHWKWVVLYGLFQGFGQFGLLFVSLKVGMTAALASVLMPTQMFFTALFSYLILAEKPGRPLIIGMVLAALGLTCFGMNYILPVAGVAGASTAIGLALCLTGASMWAASNIVVRLAQRSAPKYNTFAFLIWSSAVSVLPFVALSLLLDPPATRWTWITAPWQAWLAAAYLGLAANIVGYGMWTSLIKRYGTNRIAPFSLGVPVVGLTCGILFLGEVVTPWQWGGVVLTVLALACVVLGGRIRGMRQT